MSRILAVVIAALTLISCGSSEAQSIRVDGGIVRGKEWNGSMLFRGIPFAAPPLGPLRWKPPQPVRPWRGVRESLEQPASCVQPDQGWNHSDFLIGNEDCLTLDIRTPALGGKLPVLVWIHGGSNVAGGPNDIVLSDVGKQVVIVGIRYRLGVFGFLSHRRLTAEQGGSSGNYGLMDQVTALQWVHRNIARFVGDPANVTITGESAGTQDVSLLLIESPARQLFQKAIMESGTPGFGLPFRSLADAEKIGDQLDKLVGSGGDLRRLRAVPAAQLLAANANLKDPIGPLWLHITADGKALPSSPRQMLASAPAKPVILGSNRFEFAMGTTAELDALMAAAFGGNLARARALYRLDQPPPPPDPRLGTRDEQIATDVIFRCPTARFASIMAAKGAPVWQYEFDAAQDGGKTAHAAEIPYAFGDATFDHGVSLKPYWLNFIRSGDPNGKAIPNWPRYSSAAPTHVLFSDYGVTPARPLRPQICSLTEQI